MKIELEADPTNKMIVWKPDGGIERVESRVFYDANIGVWMRLAVVADFVNQKISLYENVLSDAVEVIGTSQYAFFKSGDVKFGVGDSSTDVLLSDLRLFSRAISLLEFEQINPTYAFLFFFWFIFE